MKNNLLLLLIISFLLPSNFIDRFRVPIYVKSSMSMGYDSNIFRLSEFDMHHTYDDLSFMGDNKKFDSWKTETIAFSDHAISFVNSGATLKCQNKVLTSSEEKEINKIVKKGFNKKDVSKVMNCEATDGDGVVVIIMNDQGHDRDVLLFGTGIETDSPIKLLKL